MAAEERRAESAWACCDMRADPPRINFEHKALPALNPETREEPIEGRSGQRLRRLLRRMLAVCNSEARPCIGEHRGGACIVRRGWAGRDGMEGCAKEKWGAVE